MAAAELWSRDDSFTRSVARAPVEEREAGSLLPRPSVLSEGRLTQGRLSPHALLQVQRTIGNRAAGRVVAERVVQRVVTKGPGGAEFEGLPHFLGEFSPALQEKIKSNKELIEKLEAWFSEATVHPLDDVMKEIQAKVGEIARADCRGIVFDPVGKVWVAPGELALWDVFMAGYEKSGGKSRQTYAAFEARAAGRAARAEKGKKPIDVADVAQLQALWGAGAGLDKWERATAIAKMFTDAGYEVTPIEESGRSSSATPPVLFDIKGHPMIAKFEIHPGGGIHSAPYIRISSQGGMIKIINKNSKPAYDKLKEAAVTYVEVSR